MYGNLVANLLAQLCFTLVSFGQSIGIADSSVDVVANWKKGDSHTVEIISTTVQSANGASQNHISTFRAQFKVIDQNDSSLVVEWVYSDAKLMPGDPMLENKMLANLLNKKMVVRFSGTGKFQQLVNADEINTCANRVVDSLITINAGDNVKNAELKTIKQAITTKQGLEIVLLKHVKFYNFSFGYNFKLNSIETNTVKFPNPLGGLPFDAVEKVGMTSLDRVNSICVIESSKTIETPIIKRAIIDYFKKVSPADSTEIENELGKAKMQMSEHTMQKIDFSKGLIQNAFFERTINLGFQSESAFLEIKTIN
jgi:hypothetical protein